ncbi:MAG TPA: hypothetical protein VMT18_14240 [Planctomycetota bacterium]|nr:hypothetical protein [Planctomycetota bacterium]
MSPSADPQAVLAALCRLHGLDVARGEDLLPLIERALTARDSVRRQVLQLVDATLRRRALETGTEDGPLLALLAGLLHGWSEGAA